MVFGRQASSKTEASDPQLDRKGMPRCATRRNRCSTPAGTPETTRGPVGTAGRLRAAFRPADRHVGGRGPPVRPLGRDQRLRPVQPGLVPDRTRAPEPVQHGRPDPVLEEPLRTDHVAVVALLLGPPECRRPQVAAGAGRGGSEAVAFRWVLDALGRHRRSIPAAPVALGFIVVLLVNRNFYQSDWFDFHFQAFATLFLVLAARELYNGRSKRALIWAAIMLLTGDVAATYAIGSGGGRGVQPGDPSGRRRPDRRARPLIILISSLHANVDLDLEIGLGYLATGHTVTIFSIVAGHVRPPQPLDARASRTLAPILNTLTTGGVVGIAAPWALFIALVVLVPNALQSQHRLHPPRRSRASPSTSSCP